jgi:hypothetical protein
MSDDNDRVDFKTERLITLWEACKAFPGKESVSIATMHRWRKNGVRGIKLQTMAIGGGRYTSHEAIARFLRALNWEAAPPLEQPEQVNEHPEKTTEGTAVVLSADVREHVGILAKAAGLSVDAWVDRAIRVIVGLGPG